MWDDDDNMEKEYEKWRDKDEDALDKLENEAAKAKVFERIAYTVMRALEENALEDFVLLQNREVREWWTGVKAREEIVRKALEAKTHRERVITEALAKLTAEEKKLLGLISNLHSD